MIIQPHNSQRNTVLLLSDIIGMLMNISVFRLQFPFESLFVIIIIPLLPAVPHSYVNLSVKT